jgi:hypothetical protein
MNFGDGLGVVDSTSTFGSGVAARTGGGVISRPTDVDNTSSAFTGGSTGSLEDCGNIVSVTDVVLTWIDGSGGMNSEPGSSDVPVWKLRDWLGGGE